MGYLKLNMYYITKDMQCPINKQTWTQVDSNPTAIGVLLTFIDSLKENEHLTISKISKEEYYETQNQNTKKEGQ